MLKHMPLPLVDIANLIKESEEIAPKVFQLAKDIQKKIYENQLMVACLSLLVGMVDISL